MINAIKFKLIKAHSLGIYVTFSITSLIIYTIVSQILAYQSGIVLDTLTTCFFGFFGGEIVMCALIKIFKLKDKKENTITDNQEDEDSVG